MGGCPSGQRELTVKFVQITIDDFMDNKLKGNLAVASAISHFIWEQYLLSTGNNCRSIEESIEQFSSKSVKPLEDGNAEPSP